RLITRFLFLPLAAASLFTVSCSIELDAPLDEFIAEQTEMVSPRAVASTGPGAPESAPDGYICVPTDLGAPASGNTVSVPLENNYGFTLAVEDPVLTTNSGGAGISGVSAAQNGDKLDITFTGTPAEGDDLSVYLVIKNADDGRVLYRGTINIAYIDFDVNLSSLELLTPTNESKIINPAPTPENLATHTDFSAADFPSPTARIVAASANGGAVISGDIGDVSLPLYGDGTVNTKTITVSAPHGVVEPKTYTLHINRKYASSDCDIVEFNINTWPKVTKDASAKGQITGTTISYKVPYGTNLASGLSPTIIPSTYATWERRTTGVSYQGPVVFRVKAEDRVNYNDYTVNVSAAALDSITSIEGQQTRYAVGATPSLSGVTIKAKDAAGYTDLILPVAECVITTPSGAFTSGGPKTVEFMHTPSGVTATYPVTVGSSACDITSFKLNSWPAVTATSSTKGQISGTTITYYVPYGTSLTSGLTPTITVSQNATWVRVTSGTGYASPVQFKVTAEDTIASKNYTVNVIVSTLTSITVNTQPTTKVYPVQAPENTGFDKAGMVIRGSDDHGYEFTITDYTLSYDFRSPGAKTVTVSYGGKTTTVTGLTAVGLYGLGVRTKRGGAINVSFSSSTSYTSSYILGTISEFINEIGITAYGPPGSGISTTVFFPTGYSVGTYDGYEAWDVVLSGQRTITIRTSYNGVTKDYTLSYNGN
ncbi:MAG: bacterial Ig-like domain-containing protein, partial [Spirochaetaceae bacterium]|nr:bacterial Ig-like domain-containing protein [Spirochaetaceae bacterium]